MPEGVVLDIIVGIVTSVICSTLAFLIGWWVSLRKLPNRLQDVLEKGMAQTLSSLNPDNRLLHDEHKDMQQHMEQDREKITSLYDDMTEQRQLRLFSKGTSMDAAHSMIDAAWEEATRFKIRFEDIKEEKACLENRIADMVDENSKLIVENEKLQVQIEELQAMNESLRKEIKRAKRKHEHTQEQELTM